MTYLYERCTANDAIDWARTLGRLSTADNPGNFTPDAIRALFDYYEQLADDLDEPIELDIIAWCCEWAEYGNIIEAAEEYSNDSHVASLVRQRAEASRNGDFVEVGLVESEILAWLSDETTVIEFDGGVLIQAF